MELAYRLVVDDHEYIKSIRNNLITLITPVVEVDGRDKMVDVYKWHLANPGKNYPNLVYWGKYVAHDNNRDAMGVTLKLTENVINTYMQWHPQVLHDLHESVPYLYDNTVGDGPYNAWIDPILADEWQMIGWNNVSEMTKFGMPGVFTHGNFDTWSPGYLMFVAALHNGISRLYETFGNGGADTVERELRPDEYARTWYKQNPAAAEGASGRSGTTTTIKQTGLLTSLHYFAAQQPAVSPQFLFEEQAIDSEGQDRRTGRLRAARRRSAPGRAGGSAATLQKQGVEISRATAVVHRDGASRRARRRVRIQRRPIADRTGVGRAEDRANRHREDRKERKDKSETVRRPRAAHSLRARTSSGWTSRTAESPTRCSTINTGARTIRSARRTTIQAGRSPNCSTFRLFA